MPDSVTAADPDDMPMLAVDTALGACSVAVLAGPHVLAHRFEIMARGHAEALAPMVQAVMRDAGLSFASLKHLAVTTGPGTFTGQRVGLAFMRGLRLGLKIPLTGITTLEAMAAAAMAQTGSTRGAALHDARRDEVYLLLRDGADIVLEPMVTGLEDAHDRIAAFGPCALAGTGAESMAARLGEGFILSTIRQPDALWVACQAAHNISRMRPHDGSVPGPLYLRAPDARLPS